MESSLVVKSKPGVLSYASSGPGSAQHLAMELLKWRTGMDIVHVPYKGSAPAISDLVGGQIPLMFDTIASALPFINSGRLKALAIGLASRSVVLPNVPTMDEAGVKGFQVAGWAGMLAPAKTPPAIIQQLNAEVLRILSQPETKEKIISLEKELAAILGAPAPAAKPVTKKRKMSTAGRARIAAAQKARWAKIKAAKKD